MRQFTYALAATVVLSLLVPAAPALAGGRSETVKTCEGGTMRVTKREKKIIKLHNDHRSAIGLKKLCVNRKLTKSARFHSREEIQHDYYAHCSKASGKCYESWSERIRRFGFDGRYCCPENLHIGWDNYSSPKWIFNSWLGSIGHLVNIVDPFNTMFGVGTARGDWKGTAGTVAFTVDFGAK